MAGFRPMRFAQMRRDPAESTLNRSCPARVAVARRSLRELIGAAMVEPDPTPTEPPLVDSVLRAVEAAQQLVLDRIDLVRFDLQQFAQRTMRGVMLVALGVFLLACAWLTLMAATAAWLRGFLPLPTSLAVVAAFTAGLAVTAIGVGIRYARGERGAAIITAEVDASMPYDADRSRVMHGAARP